MRIIQVNITKNLTSNCFSMALARFLMDFSEKSGEGVFEGMFVICEIE